MSRPSHVLAVLAACALLAGAALLQPAAPARDAPALALRAATEEQPLDLIPADASFALLVKSLADVRDKGEQFFKDNDVDPNKAPRPTDLFRDGFGWLKIKKGLNDKGTAALLLPDLKKVGITKVADTSLASI